MRPGRQNLLAVVAVTGVITATMAVSPPASAATGADLAVRTVGGRAVEGSGPAKEDAYARGYRDGYNRGYADGVDDGNDCNIDNRKKKSAARGVSDYDRGFADGYNVGYPKGYDYAYQKECR